MEARGRHRAERRRAEGGHHLDPMGAWLRLGAQDRVHLARNGLGHAVEQNVEALSLGLFEPHPQRNVRYELQPFILDRVDDPHGGAARHQEEAGHERAHPGSALQVHNLRMMFVGRFSYVQAQTVSICIR